MNVLKTNFAAHKFILHTTFQEKSSTEVTYLSHFKTQVLRKRMLGFAEQKDSPSPSPST